MRRTHRRSLALTAAAASAALAAACTNPSAAESEGGWTPEGDVTMVVPFSAGGGSDLSGRAMASGLEKVQPDLTATVENRDGGSGAVGYSYFMSKQGDPNYVLATETALLALPLTQDVEFDHKTFTPIMKVGEDYTLMVVPQDAPYETCPDVVDAAKSGRIVAGISGITGLDNVVFKMTEQLTGAKFDRVPFESGSELTAALLGGQIDIGSLNPGEVIGQLESGDLKALCAFAPERYDYPELADIPTAEEQGLDVSFAQYRGLLAPGGISEAEKQGWVEAAQKFAESPAYDEYIETNYMQPKVAFGEEFDSYLQQNSEVLAKALQ
jgi:putative tricarboxylic transport membrane protein